MRWQTLANLLGPLLVGLGAFMVFPFAWALYYGEPVEAFLYPMAITISVGTVLRLLAPRRTPYLYRGEAFALVSATWVIAAGFACLPYLFSGTLTSVVDAYFETMSGFTTTGATVLTNIEGAPRGILFWRSLTQWLGGMGIVLLFVAILPALGGGATRLIEREAPGPTTEKFVPRVREMAKILWAIYLGLSLTMLLGLLLAGLPIYDALTHTFSGISTGGFSPRDGSVGAYDNLPAELIIVVFMIAGGANFALYFRLLQGRTTEVRKDPELRLYLAIFAFFTLAVTVDLMANFGQGLGQSLRWAVFQVGAIQTATGYAVADFDAWPVFSKSALLVLMFIGGSAGSTSGAIKVARLLIAYRYMRRELFRVVHPKAVLPLRIGEQVIPERVVTEVLAFLTIYIFTFGISFLVLAGMGIPLVTGFSAAAASIGNVGPGLELIGPTASYGWMPDGAKIVLTATMLLGRLEFWTILVLLVRGLWYKR